MADDTTTAEEVAAAARRIVSAVYWITTSAANTDLPLEVWERHKRWSGDPQDALLVAQAYLDGVRKTSG